jgi:1,4-alpha-glucan branching enzyme
MIQNNRTQSEKIEFRFHAPDAKSVGVAGSFNGWDPTQTPLRRRFGGDWRAALKLTPGRHEYRFVADGKWFTDPGADETGPNPYGGCNSVRVV